MRGVSAPLSQLSSICSQLSSIVFFCVAVSVVCMSGRGEMSTQCKCARNREAKCHLWRDLGSYLDNIGFCEVSLHDSERTWADLGY